MLIVFLLLPLVLIAQDSLNVRFVGGYPFGIGYWAMEAPRIISGNINNHNYLFACSGSSIMIINVDDPQNPIKVGHILSPIALNPFLKDTLLYATAINRGLRIYNVTNPSNPVEIGNCESPGWIWSVVVKDSFAYATGPHQLVIFNVSHPQHPYIVNIWHSPIDTVLFCLDVKDDYLYLTAEDNDPIYGGLLLIFDISNPINPIECGGCKLLGNTREIVVSGNYAYIVDNALQIIDISDPANPFWASGICPQNFVYGMAITNHYAYLAGVQQMFAIVDISNPLAPFLVSSLIEEDMAWDVVVVNGYAYLNSSQGILGVDVSEPYYPFRMAEYPIITDAVRIKVSGDFAVTSSWYWPVVSTINIIEPHHYFLMDSVKIPHFYHNYWSPVIAMQGNYLYAASYSNDIFIFDISNPSNILQVGHLYVPGWTVMFDIFVQGDYLYFVSGEDYAFGIANISNPSNPYLVSGIPLSDTFFLYKIFVAGNYAYCAGRTGEGAGLKIIDVSNPYHPVPIANCSLSTYCPKIFVSNNYAYVGDDSNHCVWIIDVSNPYNPVPVSQCPIFEIGGLYASGDYLYLGSQQIGERLRILDISNPLNPVEVGYYKTPFIWCYDLFVSGNYIYAATGYTGLWVLEAYNIGIKEKESRNNFSCGQLKMPSISRKIEFSYILEGNSVVKITLIDVSGRIIKKFTTNESPGFYTKRLDDSDIPTGIYFIMVATNEWNAIGKFILLK